MLDGAVEIAYLRDDGSTFTCVEVDEDGMSPGFVWTAIATLPNEIYIHWCCRVRATHVISEECDFTA